jgi:hypothetical protein
MLRLVHHPDEAVELYEGERLLFRYGYRPSVPARESPKPYFHPLNTRGGLTVTDHRPADHPWHHGLAMTLTHLSGMNFWGGPTYVERQGYVRLDNNGRIEHRAWEQTAGHDREAVLRERLAWATPDNACWLDEERRIHAFLPDTPNTWSLDLTFRLTNVSGQPLELGTPTTQGRPRAGYGGLFWRGAPALLGGRVIVADPGLAGDDLMGCRSPWLAYSGAGATLIFRDSPANPRFPTAWFVRQTPYPGVSFSFMFDRVYVLPAGETLALHYQIALGDEEWSRPQVEAYLESCVLA